MANTSFTTITRVLIEDWKTQIIDKTVFSEEYRTLLKKVLLENKSSEINSKSYEFYIDSSLSNRGTQEIRIEAV